MFYSQFILAKKGPLGTIWIAAHLERKLRKNQVADTDIGVSVDSIIFPEVPIALRLSSHLLLGVVRIYSRKVNYLFHDCSEALLKIKQAFRSTAVDLPPEESTAPYHSITLPETFDLDDFELPDNAFFQSNSVDHHISTREQITLQDTMDGIVYSTSQFGLDERFGDGDASQIGLDLDEDLFFDKVPSPGKGSIPLDPEEDADPQTSSKSENTSSFMDIDGMHSSKDKSEALSGGCGIQIDAHIEDRMGVDDSVDQHGDQIQMQVLKEELLPCKPVEGPSMDHALGDFPGNIADVPSSDMVDCAQAPSTPGLMEGAIPSSSQEVPTLSLLRKNSLHDAMEGLTPDVNDNPHFDSVYLDSSEPMFDENVGSPLNDPDSHVGDTNHVVDFLSQNKGGPKSDFDPVQNMENKVPHDILQSVRIEHCRDSAYPSESLWTASNKCSLNCGLMAEPLQDDPVRNGPQNIISADQNAEPIGTVEDSCPPNHELRSNADCQLGSGGKQHLEIAEGKGCTGPPSFKNQDTTDPDENVFARVHVLQACSSSLNQPHELPMEGGMSVNAPHLLFPEVGLHASATNGKELSHAGVASAEVQGEDHCLANVRETNMELVQQMPGSILSEAEADLNKSDEFLDSITSKNVHLEASKSSDFPAPETLLLAPAGISELPTDLMVHSTTEKETVMEVDGTAGRFHSLSGKKRPLIESTPALQNTNSARISRTSRSKRSMDYIPEDDDVLASILVGRTSSLKMQPTPSPLEIASSKRRRVTPRARMLKRKVSLDDTMVLHGDVIRQQLTNTEDIHRIRRKAPCTRYEIWMIHKYILEDEIFSEPLLAALSAELLSSQKQTYHQMETGLSLIDADNVPHGVLKELEQLRGKDVISEVSVEGIGEAISAMPEKNDGQTQEPTEATLQSGNQQPGPSISSLGCDTREQTEALSDMPQPDSSKNALSREFTAMEIDALEKGDSNSASHAVIAGFDMPTLPAQQSEDACNIPTDSKMGSSSADKKNEMEASLEDNPSNLFPGKKPDDSVEIINDTLHLTEPTVAQKDVSIGNVIEDPGEGASIAEDASIAEEMKQWLPQECHNGVIEVTNGDSLIPVLGNCLVESGADISAEPLNQAGSLHPIRDVLVESGEPGDVSIVDDGNALEGIRTSELVNVVEGDQGTEKVTYDEDGQSPEVISTEGSYMTLSYPLKCDTDLENHPSDGGKTSWQEADQQAVIDGEMSVTEIATLGDDFDYMLDENDTEFLNVDDEMEPAEEEDDELPNAEEDQFIENSGWSSRTRAVSRYLKSLFDNEAGRGRKNVQIDNLLAGKTRKEASRMFFEMLVLKTKDYIHVEQGNPFGNITILPTVKLMKSEF